MGFAVIFLICLACKPLIPVNYDMNDYLPADTASTVALDTMEKEYEGGIPNAVSYTHLDVYKRQL